MLPKLNRSSFRGLMWICTSLVIGVLVAAVGASKGFFRDPDTRLMERGVFLALWLASMIGGVALLRRTNRASAETA